MKILVLGAGGMMGHMSCRVLAENHEVYGTVRSAVSDGSPLLSFIDSDHLIRGVDVLDLQGVDRLIADLKPDVVLNCIGIVKQLEAAHDAVMSIESNSLMPHQLAVICTRRGARLVHLSTDCVFSGRKGNYTIEDIPDPVDLYGRSKLLGELDSSEGLTIRTSIVGRQLSGDTSLFEWILANRNSTVRGFSNAIYSGLTTHALAGIIGQILESHQHLTGVWQIASEPINKYDLVVRLNTLLDLGMNVEPDDTVIIDRSLDGSDFANETGIEVPTWSEMLDQFAADQAAYAGLGSELS